MPAPISEALWSAYPPPPTHPSSTPILSTLNAEVPRRLKQEADLKSHALSLLEERVRGSESAQLAERVASLTAQVDEAAQAARTAREQKAAMVAAAKVRCTFFYWMTGGGGGGGG